MIPICEYTIIYIWRQIPEKWWLERQRLTITHKVHCHHHHHYHQHHHHHHHLYISIFWRTWNIRYTEKYWLRTEINSLLCNCRSNYFERRNMYKGTFLVENISMILQFHPYINVSFFFSETLFICSSHNCPVASPLTFRHLASSI